MNTWIEYLSFICDVLLVVGAFSAFAIYFIQKKSEKRMAATLILGQVDSIDKALSVLKTEPLIDDVLIFKLKPFLEDNMWEKYKHLFAKVLSSSEYQLVQTYFEQAELLERRRVDIVNTIYSAWKDKSSVEHQLVGQAIFDKTKNNEEIEEFRMDFRTRNLLFLPDIAIATFINSLKSFNLLSGSTAYAKLNKKAYLK